MEKIRDNKGITLIVLIITIIVLLIIAGISISGAINGIEEADTNRLITELEKVQHAVTERYSKYELTKDASVLVGTKIDLTSLTDVPESVKWKVFQATTASQTSTHPERKYYRLSKSDLENLGLTGDYRGSSYIVNYYSGEAYDEAEIQTSDGTVLYKTGIENEASELGDEVIRNGLLVWYDAINNTGSGHSSSTKTWFDLSGNGNNATLYNFDGIETSGWNSNYLAFDGQKDYVTGAFNLNGDITVELVAKKNNSNTSTMYMLNSWATQAGSNPSLQLFSGLSCWNRILVPNNENDSYKEISNIQLGSSNTQIITKNTITKSSYDISTYMNKQLIKKYTDSSFIERFNITDVNFTIGKWHNSNSYFSKQDVYAMRVYNRALTEDEIRHNYILDKNRYGIEE